jgi:hypothetical protein
MQPLWCNAAALAVAVIFYAWRAYRQAGERRQRQRLRERVAFLLWNVAHEAEDPATHATAS